MAEVLGEENVVQFQEQLFCFLHNSTNVGGITAEELAVVIRSLDQNPSDEEVEELMNDEIAELITLMAQSFKETENEDEFKEAFKVFDKDQTGYISATELRNVMVNLGEKLTEEEAQLMIKEADSDGDGLVNYDDFVKMMRTL